MELFIFARFHARPGQESAVAEALRDIVAPSRAEPGCLDIHAFRSTRDGRLFYIHSRWTNEAAFEVHAGLPDTDLFVERMQALIDPPSRLYALERSIRRSSVTLQILSRCRTPCAGSRPQDRPA